MAFTQIDLDESVELIPRSTAVAATGRLASVVPDVAAGTLPEIATRIARRA